MLSKLFEPKVFCLEVTQGIDIEKKTYLNGTRVTIGSGDSDTLHIGASDVCQGHLVFQRPNSRSDWEYQSSDAGLTQVRRGNPRSGKLRAGQSFQIGATTRISVRRIATPADLKEQAGGDGKTELPLYAALAAIALISFAGVFAANAMTGGDRSALSEASETHRWFEAPTTFTPELKECLASAEASWRVERIPMSEPDALFHSWLESRLIADGRETMFFEKLRKELGQAVVKAQILIQGGDRRGGAEALREIENRLPISAQDCPITRAARADIAALELTLSR